MYGHRADVRPDTLRLRFRITPPEGGSEPGPVILASRALQRRALLFTICVGFVGGQLASFWKYAGASPFA